MAPPSTSYETTIENPESWKTLLDQRPLGSYFANPYRFAFDADNLDNLVDKTFLIDATTEGPNWCLAARTTREKTAFSIGPLSIPLPFRHKLVRTIADSIYWTKKEDLTPILGAISQKLKAGDAQKVHLHYFRLPYPKAYGDLKKAVEAAGLSLVTTRGMPLYRCSLEGEEPPSRRLKSKTRNTLSRKSKKLESEYGALSIQSYTDSKQADAFFEAIERLSPQTWQRHSGMGGLRDNLRFRNVYQHECEQGRMKSYLLFAGEKPIAYQFGTTYNGIYNYEILGYDNAFGNYSPGQLLRLHSFDELHEEGVYCIDFGPGEYEYKSQWGTEQFELMELRIFGHSFCSKLLCAKEKLETSITATIKSLKNRNKSAEPRPSSP